MQSLVHRLTWRAPLHCVVRHPQVVTDTHLLQFGAMIGEASAELALSQAGSPGAVGREPACLFGMYDKREQYREVRTAGR